MTGQKVALVSGATRGIGYAIAEHLALDGFALAVTGTRPEQDVLEALKKLRALEQPVLYIQGDISQSADRTRWVDTTVQNYGRIDALVNNAGVAPEVRRDLLEMTEESMDRVLGINLKGTFFLTQAVAKEMIILKQQGLMFYPVIVNISSVSAYAVSTQRGEYCISKAGLSAVTQLFADRLAEYGIGVHEIRPGVIKTDMTAGVTEKYNTMIAAGLSPIKRWGMPEDVAEAASFLCSGRLSFSTGEVINVDGGYHIRRL